MTLAQLIKDRNIDSTLHFTTNRGIVGILAVRALLSRRQLSEENLLEYVLLVNAATRPEAAAAFDKNEDWLDYVNLSISEVNGRFLQVSKRWHANDDVWWCILEFDPSVMTHDGVYFATTNNSYDRCSRAKGAGGFEALFAERVDRKSNGWFVDRHERPPNLPTCEQAEVLYPRSVDTKHLRRIYVMENEHHDIVGGWLQEFGRGDVHVTVSKEKFGGQPN